MGGTSKSKDGDTTGNVFFMILATLDYLKWNRNSVFLYRIKNPENVFYAGKNIIL